MHFMFDLFKKVSQQRVPLRQVCKQIQQMMDHERARVAYEERGRFISGWILRYLYRPLIAPAIRRMDKSDS